MNNPLQLNLYTFLATVTGSPTGGTFTITVNNSTIVAPPGQQAIPTIQSTAAIAYNAAASAVQSALAALSNVGAGVQVSGSAGGPWTIVFPQTDAPSSVAIGTNSLTGGTTPNVTFAGQAPSPGVANTASVNIAATSTAALSNGGNWDLEGTPFECAIPITTLKHSAGNETYTFVVQDSPDGSTWTARSAVRAATDDSGPGNTDGGSGTIHLRAEIKNIANVRLVVTLGGTSPSITLGAVTVSPVFMFFIEATVQSTGGGAISFAPLMASTELSEPICAAANATAANPNAQGMQNLNLNNLLQAATAFFPQGTKAMIAFAPTS